MRSACIAVLLVALPGAAQQKPASPTSPLVWVSVELVQVDAVVSDGKGRHVSDLGVEDFEVLEDGRPQALTHFSYTSVRAPRVAHLLTIVVDDLGMSPLSILGAKQGLASFVESLSPEDRLAIVRTGDGVGAMQVFTSDRPALLAAIAAIRWNPLSRSSSADRIAVLAPDGRVASPYQLDEVRAKQDFERDILLSHGSISTLSRVVQGLAPFTGRKDVVVVSESFPSSLGLTEAANRASVVIHTLDPRGVGVTALDDIELLARSGPRKFDLVGERLAQQRLERRRLEGLALARLPEETGGLAVFGNDLADGLGQILDDQQGYYLLGYEPLVAKAARGNPTLGMRHGIRVKLKRSGLSVRARRSAYTFAAQPEAAALHGRALLRQALFSPFASGADLRLGLIGLLSFDRDARPALRGSLQIASGDVTFGEAQDGWRKAEIDVATLILGPQGEAVQRKDEAYTVRLREGEDLPREGFVYPIELKATRPGRHLLRVGVRDVRSDRVGTAGLLVDVPDASKSKLVVSSLMVGSSNEGGQWRMRRYQAGEAIEYRCQIVGRTGKGARARVVLMASASSAALVEESLLVEGARGGAVATLNGRLRLPTSLAPGHYTLEMTLPGASPGQQWAEIEVVP